MAERLTQGRDTLPAITWKAAGNPDRIHPGTRRYLAQLGLNKPSIKKMLLDDFKAVINVYNNLVVWMNSAVKKWQTIMGLSI